MKILIVALVLAFALASYNYEIASVIHRSRNLGDDPCNLDADDKKELDALSPEDRQGVEAVLQLMCALSSLDNGNGPAAKGGPKGGPKGKLRDLATNSSSSKAAPTAKPAAQVIAAPYVSAPLNYAYPEVYQPWAAPSGYYGARPYSAPVEVVAPYQGWEYPVVAN